MDRSEPNERALSVEFRQLEALTAVAEHRTFSAAARALHTVQSNISTHVSKLERELEVELVDRANNRLTPEGEVVVARARRISAELRALTSDVASVQAEVVGTTVLGLIGTTGRWLTPTLVRLMPERHPRVRLVVAEATTSGLLPQLENGHIDLAIVNLPLESPEFDVQLLFEEDLVLIAPQNHPLAAHKNINIVELGDHALILGPPASAMRRTLDAAAKQVGIHFTTIAEVDGVRLQASLAFDGFGATIVPRSAAPNWLSGSWVLIPIDGMPRRQVGLAQRRHSQLSAPAHALLSVMDDALRSAAEHYPEIHIAQA
ncbi:MAG: LysR family transcriptional regulator [Acidimicrobiales bacterium]